ncbi:glycosyltransferase family 2 protein [Rhodobacter ferrooxidans]|uniref:Glycosyl transferase family 2 n=1 Tax=Rhodobacter ferrooxidans TaxID=371731 RepID=C8RXI0_9RHOB|nr:glycosyl transferase family 2 [Rhodobacter sp. SW2]
MLSVIIPANNEAGYIGACLQALLASDPVPGGAEALVVANGCRDATADLARGFGDRAAQAGWGLTVLNLTEGSKPAALNAGDAVARGEMRAYLDADVQVSTALMAQLAAALATPSPGYASGTPQIPPARSPITRAYARFWQRLPFAQSPAPGYGLYAVNAAGRARWGAFPDIISDDTFVRLHFDASERIACPAPYLWPMIEGFGPLVRVRRRQDAGVAEIARLYPDLPPREAKPPLTTQHLARLALTDPAGFATYAAVALTVRLKRNGAWTRGR